MRQGLFVTSVVFGAAALLACNAILDFDSFGVEVGETDSGTEQDAGPQCSTNQDCATLLGEYSICRKQDNTCVKLVSPECPKILGNWQSDDAVVLGAIQPLFGADATTGIPVENAISVAIDEFTQGSNGLPAVGGSGRRRPIAVVSCTETTDDENDSEAMLRSADHLISIGVPAIIGAAYSGDTIRVSEKTIHAGVLLMSPTATSIAITDLQDDGLVWRTSPSDVIQASAFAALMPQVEQMTRNRIVDLPESAPLRVWVFHKGDSYGIGLADALSKTLTFNGKSALSQSNTDYVVKNYGDTDSGQDTTATQLAALQAAIADDKEPHIIFMLGTNEVHPKLVDRIEKFNNWGAKERPTYLFSDGGEVPELWELIGGDKEELRLRVFGTVPGTNNPTFQTFKLSYDAKFPDGTSSVSGTANGYDALYTIAYAIAAIGDEPVTGANIAKGLGRLVPPGQIVRPGSNNISTALSLLASGQNIDYDGASGPLDFDLDKGEATSDIQLWCVPSKDGKAAPAINSGVFYDATNQVAGDLKLFPPDPSVVAACSMPTPTPTL